MTYEREDTQAAWDSIAAGYDEFVTPTHMSLANEVLSLAGLRPDMRFLDVAPGEPLSNLTYSHILQRLRKATDSRTLRPA